MCLKEEDVLKHLLQTKGYRNLRHCNGDKVLQERSPWKGLYRQKTFQRREVLCLVFETFEGSTLAEKSLRNLFPRRKISYLRKNPRCGRFLWKRTHEKRLLRRRRTSNGLFKKFPIPTMRKVSMEAKT